jgi:rhodanese-related sulfurtransferase
MEQIIEFTNNNALLVAGMIIMALAVMFFELRLKTSGLAAISSAQAVGLINQGASVVDVREKDQFAQGHIVDAINIPASDLADSQDKRLNKSKSIILICDNGSKSSQCATTLKKAGFENTYSLNGGLAGWQRDNLPTVASDA